MSQRGFHLVDTETADLVGAYRSKLAALRDVAEAVRRYGRESPEARSLALIRRDVPAELGLIARGPALVDLALKSCAEAPSARPARSVLAG